MKNLPIGIQTFSEVRQNDLVYIDKTSFVWQMIQQPTRIFLSRPRRFGKSLLVDTLKEVFEGNQALFKGLYIENKWDWSQTFPVIKLNFAGGQIQTLEQLNLRLEKMLLDHQQKFSVHCRPDFLADKGLALEELIDQVAQKTQQKVVVLVDEYDKPILDNIEKIDMAQQIREAMKNLYSALKNEDDKLQFVFMTGVSKFSKVSLFTGLNQLEDISLDPSYAAICGYTQEDLQVHFAEHLAGIDWEKLKNWYNGYHFLGESVYNPFDILLFISKNKTYRSYWFETGSPSFLIKLFRQHRYFLPDLEAIEVGEEVLDSFEIEKINPITLLFQTGYLTITKTSEKRQILRFHLAPPNFEVQQALADHFTDCYSQTPPELRLQRQDRLYDALEAADFIALKQEIQSLFAAIPWRNFTKNDLPDAEGYYASVIYAWLSSLNASIIPEDITNHGQVDLTVKLAEQIFIIEIKLDHSDSYSVKESNCALNQIFQRNYAAKYLAENQPIHQIGLIFNSKQRNLVQMDWQSL